MATSPRSTHGDRPRQGAAAALARSRPAELRAWLRDEPPLDDLRAIFPTEWAAVEHELAALADAAPERIADYVAGLSTPLPRPFGGPAVAHERQLLALEARRLMAASVLRAASFSAATGRSSGRVRFNLVNGAVAQRLFFARGLERKPVALGWYRAIWPLLWQRHLLMPLVERRGSTASTRAGWCGSSRR